MQRLEVRGAVRLIYSSLGVKGLSDGTTLPTPAYFKQSLFFISNGREQVIYPST